MFVLDASLTLTWAFDEEETEYTRAVLAEMLEHVVLAPSVWPLEVTNAAVMAARQRRIDDDEVRALIELVRGLDVEVDGQAHRVAFDDVATLAQEHGLTSCDAACIELALRRDAPLATVDAGLARAARAIGRRCDRKYQSSVTR
jgi:predicted nucleic acid-binding protein